MRVARLAPLVLVLVLAGSAQAASHGPSAPTGLHAFMLRADAAATRTFHTTPSFAWNPVAGAKHYEFQLSLDSAFHDNSVVYGSYDLKSPVAAPGLTLPWITGNPHSLYARVRAVSPSVTTPWSAPYGFDVVPPSPPAPLPAAPGLLRWTPVAGAAGYEIWLLDAGKMEYSFTNVLDERDYYTFHQAASWTGTVHWRIRAMRWDYSQIAPGSTSASSSPTRVNGIPAVQYGAWSSTYVTTNPAYSSGGALTLVGTLSDVACAAAGGAGCAKAHQLMPSFVWSGDVGLNGKAAELFRVEVFTDRQCLNRVFTGAVVGSPAYAPRPLATLGLPTTVAAVTAARTHYLGDGVPPPVVTLDGDKVQTTEASSDATPTVAPPGTPGATSAATPTTPTTTTPSSSTSSSTPTSGAPQGGLTITSRTGAPVDLWDTAWPESGYYWTVVPVAAVDPSALTTNVSSPGATAGSTTLPTANSGAFNVGDTITIGAGQTLESATVQAAAGGLLTLAAPLKYGHGVGETIVRSGSGLVYTDLELPQDACAAGRVARFGKDSEPSLTSSGSLFATGLSSHGRLTSALHNTAFYGQPLVAWQPALGASTYEVQWSKTKYPFVPRTAPSGAKGIMTFATAVVLPVPAGTWWYRVRGFDYSLPTGAQQMTWSDPVKLVVAHPTFKIVKAAAKKKTKHGAAKSSK